MKKLTRGRSWGAAVAVMAAMPSLVLACPLASGADTTAVHRLAPSAYSTRYVPGEVLIGFRPHTSRAAKARVNARVPSRVAARVPAFRMELVKLARGMGIQAAIRRYERDPAVAFAEPNYLRHPTADPPDALFTDQWDLKNTGQPHVVADDPGHGPPADHAGTAGADIHAATAWATEKGSSTVVAVIDTGVDVTQPDLDGQLWVNPGDPTVNGTDDDLNDKVDDVHGWNFAGDNATLLPPQFTDYEHGTHVAGTIAAELNDSGTNDGIVGVCPACKIMVLRIATNAGDLPLSAEIGALNYAKSKGAKIANMSLGGPEWSNAEREAVRLSGMLVVVAAGNESLDNDMSLGADVNGDGTPDVFSPSYPAAYSLNNILSVAASNDEDRYAYSTECFQIVGLRPPCAFTNWGHDSVDLAAPGVDITSTAPGGNYLTWDGTSMAAPHVAGVAGLVLAHHPTYTPAQVKNAIMNSVDRPSTLHTMYISTVGNGITKTGAFTRTSGRLNAAAALGASTANATPLTDGNINGARAMTVAKVGGSVSWPADINDVRKRRLLRGHTYRIKLIVPAGKDYDLYVWKPGTKEIWQPARLRAHSALGKSKDEVVTFKASSTGTYYIQVSAWFANSGKYTLSIARLS